MRLIDADKLLDDFQIWPICDDCAQLEDTKCELSGMYICLAIQNAPTVDAIPVVWLKGIRDIMQKQSSRAAADLLSRVIEMWENEQEGEA